MNFSRRIHEFQGFFKILEIKFPSDFSIHIFANLYQGVRSIASLVGHSCGADQSKYHLSEDGKRVVLRLPGS